MTPVFKRKVLDRLRMLKKETIQAKRDELVRNRRAFVNAAVRDMGRRRISSRWLKL